MLQRSGNGTADVENQGFGRDLRGLVGSWPDTDGILQGAMSEGLRDWDLWYVFFEYEDDERITMLTRLLAGDHLCSVFYSVCFCRSARVGIKRIWCFRGSSLSFGWAKRWWLCKSSCWVVTCECPASRVMPHVVAY